MTLLTTGTESLTQIYEFVHDFYFPKFMKMYPNYAYLHDKLKTKKVDGRRYVIKYEIGGNVTARNASERGALPTAKGRLAKEGTGSCKYTYGPIDLTGPELWLTKGSQQVPIDVIGNALTGCMKNFLWTCNVQTMGDGSGRICQVNGNSSYDATTGLTTITVDNGSLLHLARYQSVSGTDDGTDYEIKSIDRINNTFTVGGDATTDFVNDDYVMASDTYAATLDSCITGLRAHVSDSNPPSGTYQGLSRSTTGYEFLSAYVKDGASAAITELSIIQFLDEVQLRCGEMPNLGMVAPGVRNSIVLLMNSLHRTMDPVVGTVGFEKLAYTFNGKPFEFQVVQDLRAGDFYALNTDYMYIAEGRPTGWMTDEGNPKLKLKSGYDIFEGTIARYWDIVCDNPYANGYFKSIKENSIS